MNAGRIDLHLRIRIKEGRRAEFLAFLREAIPKYEAPGGIEVRLLERLDDEHEFIEVVHYENERAYAADQERVESDPRFRALLERWRELLVDAPAIEVFRRVAP
jgi:quinol monooxygenase YgiN